MISGAPQQHLRRLRVAARTLAVGRTLKPLRHDPGHTALFLDIDGTLSRIAPKPDLAVIPTPTRTVLRRLTIDYHLVGVVTGRRALNARELVGLDIDYAGNHGIEQISRGSTVVTIDPAVAPWVPLVRDFVRDYCTPGLLAHDVRVEDKEIIVTLHWRGARDEKAARAAALAAAAHAESIGLRLQYGRGVVEIRPPVAIDKGTAVRHLLDAHPEVRHVLYAGDDRTDADAMRALWALKQEGRLDTVVRVGVKSREVPADIVKNSDLLVGGPDGVRRVLRHLVLR